MEQEIKELLERGVRAMESLAQDPVIEMQTGPPVCPNCERVNPMVRVEESEAQGNLAEFIIQAHCLHCNSVFYAVPLQWSMSRGIAEAEAVLRERAEIGVYSQQDQTAPS